MVSLLDIRSFFKGTIKLGEPLANYASLGIGGAADYVFSPSSREDLIAVVAHLRESAIPFIFAGRGSNLLVSEQGYHGAVIMLEPGVSAIRLERPASGEALVHAAAGARIASLVDFCITHSLQGAEELAGMSGTVGGMVMRSTAGLSVLPEGCVKSVELLRDGGVMAVSDAPEKIDLRKAGLGRDVALSASFRFMPGNKEELMRRRREILVRRNSEQPLNVANAGLMFQDPPGKNAAGLVVDAGMKGFRRGGAAISDRHANMVLNTGNATVADVLTLIKHVQSVVREKKGVQLALAMRLAGFDQESLREVA